MADGRREVPRTDAVLADPRLVAAAHRLGAVVVKTAVRETLDRVRRGEVPPAAVADVAYLGLPPRLTSLRPVLNATGVVVHTNLGRAPLSDAAIDAIVAAAGNVDLEYDLATGVRGSRGAAVATVLTGLVPSAGAAHVVNNGAAAVVLAATVLAAGREIVVSRGELVEIGAGFRLPDLLTSTGARLREVGTTNRTAASDYAAAMGPDTAMVLKVHPSNFVVQGFTAAADVSDLASLCRDRQLPLVFDIGSGLLAPDPLLPGEPDATSTLTAGADLVTASGDKLLGGPQAGLLLGRSDIVERLRRHPLARALRVDKLTLAALEATLRGPLTPVAAALHADAGELERRCILVAEELRAAGVEADVVSHDGVVGGGGAPGVGLPGWAVALPPHYAVSLRRGDPPVIGRVDSDRCLLDLRCVPAERDGDLTKAVLAL